MASIVQNILGDNALQLGNEEFVRKMQWGNNWNSLRIGARVTLNGAANLSGIRLQLGVCNGDTNTWSSATCAGYVAACCGAITNSGGTALGFDGTNYRYSGPGVNDSGYTSKLGSTVSDAQGGSNGAYQYIAATGSGNKPSILMADIGRASASSYTVAWHVVNATQLAQNPRFYDLLRSMEDPGLSGYGATFVTARGANTRTGMPSNMDTLSVYWNYATPTIEFSEICVIRFN